MRGQREQKKRTCWITFGEETVTPHLFPRGGERGGGERVEAGAGAAPPGARVASERSFERSVGCGEGLQDEEGEQQLEGKRKRKKRKRKRDKKLTSQEK